MESESGGQFAVTKTKDGFDVESLIGDAKLTVDGNETMLGAGQSVRLNAKGKGQVSTFGRQELNIPTRGGVRIHDIADFKKMVKQERIDIAVVAVPAEAAQSVISMAVQAGIRAILNFSPGNVKVPAHVKLKNVDLTVSLESLSFFLAREDQPHDERT